MSLRSTLGRVRGLGSARQGVEHWWQLRATALALVVLGPWFVVSMVSLVGADHAAVRAWASTPGNAMTLILFIGTLFIHARLGMREVVEDYIHHEGWKVVATVIVTFGAIFCAVACALAVLRLSFGVS